MIRIGTSRPVVVTASVAVLLADVLDAVSWVVLDLAGLDRDQARAVLAVLWGDR